MQSGHAQLLRVIAVFKLLKAALLIAVGVGLLKMIHADLGAQIEHWVVRLGLDPGSRFVVLAIEKATRIPPQRIGELGIATFLYAALFLTEGIGLWLLKRWAEWFTIIATGSLIPIEAFECYRHLTLMKAGVLAVNIAIVVYLAYRVVHEQQETRPAAA